MTDFSNLKAKADIKADNIVRFNLSELEGDMWLDVAPATNANKPFFNEFMKKSKLAMRALQNKQVTADIIDQSRESDKPLYAKYIIKGWQVIDAGGQAVAFCEENVLEFLQQLPNWIVDDLRSFCSNNQNFTNDMVDASTKAKN